MAALRRRGESFASIARDAGLKRQTLYWATIRPHPRANEAIAAALGLRPHDLWPHWFDRDGALISTAPLPRAQLIPRGHRRSSLRQRPS